VSIRFKTLRGILALFLAEKFGVVRCMGEEEQYGDAEDDRYYTFDELLASLLTMMYMNGATS
jgi:phosphatidylglycerophosphatase A